MEIIKLAQDENFSQYYSGDVPDYMANLIGTPNVDTSRISGTFSGSNKAIEMVNNFNGSLLKNISVIFNSSDSGSYGVYVPALDKAIKTKALKNLLEQKGYEIKDENGVLTAHPKEKDEKTQDQINQDIKTLYAPLESGGGTAFGLNMGKILSAAKEDAENIIRSNQSQGQGNVAMGSQKLFELLAIIHLGSTIVHEAIHAKGSEGEGPSEQGEAQFRNWAVPQITSQFQSIMKEMGFNPEQELKMNENARHAKTSANWYKLAQYTNYVPGATGAAKDSGSDRMNGSKGSTKNPSWQMRNRSPSSDNIESKLSREFMAQLPKDLSQEHDIIEMQLRKNTRGCFNLDPKLIFEELLEKDRPNDFKEYKTTEELLEESRPSPLMKTIKNKQKVASINKVALESTGFFGYMNNLDMGMNDRVIPFESAEEDFQDNETDIRSQSRYNQEYDLKGFYYRWIEPQFAPQLFNDMTQDYTNTHPAKRFGQTNTLSSEINKITSILRKTKKDILNGEINATRFISTENIAKLINKVMDDDKIKIDAFYVKGKEDPEIMAIWIYNLNINSDDIEVIERAIQEKRINEVEKELHKMLKPIKNHSQEIINVSEKICHEYKIKNMNIIGTYAREKSLGNDSPDVTEICFNCGSTLNNIKFGNILAEKLKVDNLKYSKDRMIMFFKYKNISVIFYAGFAPNTIINLMKQKNISTSNPLYVDLCNRDFTLNMATYNVCDKTVSYPFKEAVPTIGKVETFFDPNIIIKNNPIIILRAIYLKIKYGCGIDPKLEKAIIQNAPLLVRKKNDVDVLRSIRYLKEENRDVITNLFSEYGLDEFNKE